MSNFNIDWVDRYRESECPSNPDYPDGINIDLTSKLHARKACKTSLPYPAKRCGYFMITCVTCGLFTIITTAGRPDDPKSLLVYCKIEGDQNV